MSFDLWGINGIPFVGLPGHLAGYAVLGLYALLLFIALAPALPDFLKLKPTQWLLLAALMLAAPVLITALKIRFPGTVAPPGVPDEPVGPSLSLLGYTPIILAAGFLGSGPAILVGLAAGLARAGWETFEITTAFEMTLAAALFSWMIRQSYRGWLPRVIRIPPLASVVTATALWLISFLSYLANSTALGLSGIDFITAEWVNGALPLSGELLIGGVIGMLGLIAFPAAWAPRAGRLAPPYSSSLNNRLLFTFLPLSFISLLFLIWASSRIAIQVATSLIVDQMGNDAESVANTVPYFAQTGQSILSSLAADPHLQDPNPPELEPWLSEQIRSIAFFRHLAFLDLAGDVIGAYPPGEGPANELTPEEETALSLGLPQTITVYPRDPVTEKTQIQVSFIVPVFNQSGAQIGTLIGRADIENNPLLRPAIDQLNGLTADGGQGFILDDRNNIIYHLDQTQLLQLWLPAEQPDETFPTASLDGQAYRDRAPGNTRQLVYTLPVTGFPWSVVIMTPNEVVLAQATRIVGPFVALLSIIGVIGAGIVLWVTSRITLPLETLAKATASIAQGEFNRPVQIAGEDEVGRLGIAFERMRERLRARLEELNLLLGISQGIAGSLNLDQSLPDLLEGAMTSTKSNGVRLIIRSQDDVPAVVFSDGPLSQAMSMLDKDLLNLTEHEDRPVRLENLARARAVIDASKVSNQVQALIALPLRQESQFLGTLWVGFSQTHSFTESEVNFLTTLAGQAAVAISNANLYEASEGGRQQLQAILASSPDAVIVIDRRERVLLLNPAAETIFRVNGATAVNRPLAEVINRTELIELARNPQLGTPRQVPLDDGRTMFASASPIMAGDGNLLGQVMVLRDVTYFKQLDELKSEFVATVSHDLRVPLTFMRGYASMLPMVGQLNPKQGEFADKIVVGIEQMSELIEDLLDLNRIEAGVGLARETCQINDLVNSAVSNFRNNAANKNIALSLQLADDLPTISGDKTLLRQAISNLVDNAIKYTAAGGRVKIVSELREQNVVVSVQDTGIGIAPSDQARLFEKFFRVKQRDTIGIKGSGLGLAIVKSIVERHGGRSWVESRLGQGSSFYMALPL